MLGTWIFPKVTRQLQEIRKGNNVGYGNSDSSSQANGLLIISQGNCKYLLGVSVASVSLSSTGARGELYFSRYYTKQFKIM